MVDAATEIAALRAALAASEARANAIAAEAAHAKAVLSGSEALIAHLRLEIEKLRRALYGHRSERKQRLLDQLELQLEELEATASEDEAQAEAAAKRARTATAPTRRRPSRKPFPEHLPRERVVIAAPCSCAACGSDRIAKMGEDISETLEVVPRSWKVIQTVREKFTCRDCERISQAPAPYHPTPRGWAGPSLLAMIVFEKFGQHQPLNRQADRYAREGVELSLSTLADQVGAVAAALAPLHALIEAHVMAAGRLHGDDTPVPLLAKGKTRTARLWTYARDDRPFGGPAPPAALFRFSTDRKGEHPRAHLHGWSGVLQADAYAGFNGLYAADRTPKAVTEALCWAHARRKLFELADIAANARRGDKAAPISPLALEAVKRIDAVFDAERAINGLTADERLAVRRDKIRPLVDDLRTWMTAERARLSRHAPVARAMDYMLARWEGFAGFLDDGRICLTNNAAERSLRGVALGRKAWLFAGSERGGERAALMYTLIVTAKLNGVDPQAWLADVIARIADAPISRLAELLPWNWIDQRQTVKAA
jgi:transposase